MMTMSECQQDDARSNNDTLNNEDDLDSNDCILDEASSHRSSISSFNSEAGQRSPCTRTNTEAGGESAAPLFSNSAASWPEPLQAFWNAARNDKVFYDAIRDYHRRQAGTTDPRTSHSKRLETPSASIANHQANIERHKFEIEVINSAACAKSKQLRQLWSDLLPNQRDEFLCHVFLPKEMGGFFARDED